MLLYIIMSMQRPDGWYGTATSSVRHYICMGPEVKCCNPLRRIDPLDYKPYKNKPKCKSCNNIVMDVGVRPL